MTRKPQRERFSPFVQCFDFATDLPDPDHSPQVEINVTWPGPRMQRSKRSRAGDRRMTTVSLWSSANRGQSVSPNRHSPFSNPLSVSRDADMMREKQKKKEEALAAGGAAAKK